jgi:four helix bundle protein
MHNSGKQFDLEDRTEQFAADVRAFIRKIRPTIYNESDIKQVLRSSGSVGSNYIEANEALGKKDFRMRIKISKKESKESRYWLRLLKCSNELQTARQRLIAEATELMLIFGAILRKAGP